MDVIFDLDGTLADLTHRRHFVMVKPKNWPAFFEGISEDTPIEPIARIARLMALGNRVIICSGRYEDLRESSEAWLKKHVWGENGALYHDAMYMRANGDYRGDDIVKEELLDRILADGYKPELVFDDRDRVVKMWRARGIVCCQCNYGDF